MCKHAGVPVLGAKQLFRLTSRSRAQLQVSAHVLTAAADVTSYEATPLCGICSNFVSFIKILKNIELVDKSCSFLMPDAKDFLVALSKAVDGQLF